ncbi:MAG: hypothetical protein HY829_00840 [Actinobacteria bacterium]|nr:hypothetical protein [Actinomycetota bacterium]
MITLYCQETPELKLGPGSPTDPSTIVFRLGFAEIAELTPDIARWITHPGTPHIEILEGSEGRVAETTPDAWVCPACAKAFGTEKQGRMHLLSHRPKE